MDFLRKRLGQLPASRYWASSLLLITILSALLVLFFRAWTITLYDAEIGGYEYEIIFEVQKILTTGSVYSDPGAPPYHFTQKTPVYQYLIAIICSFDKAYFLDDPIRLFRLNRIVSLLLSAGSAIFFFFLLRKRFEIGTGTAWIGALLCFGSFGQHYYGRMDGLYVLIFLLLLLVALSVRMPGFLKAFSLALLTSLAVFTKQSGVLYIPIVISLLAIMEAKPVKTIIRYLAFGAAMAALLWIFWAHSNLDVLYKNLVLGLSLGKSWGFLSRVLLSESFGPLFLFGIGSIVLLVKDRSELARVLVVLLFITLLMSLYLLRNKGAGINYITEFRLAVILSLAYILEKANWGNRIIREWVFAIFVLHLSFVNVLYLFSMRSAGQWQNDKEAYRQQALVSGYVSENISEGEYVYWIGEESFYGNRLFRNIIFPVKVTPCMIIRNNPETIDFSLFLEQMNNGSIRYLISEQGNRALKDNCFGQAFHNYEKRKGFGRYQVWEWRGE